jgi:hypothetical protein
MKIDFIVFDGSKKTLYVRIIGGPAFAVHGDFDCFQTFDVFDIHIAGKLASLIGIDDFRSPMMTNGLLKATHHPFGFHGVGGVPTHDIPAMHIDNLHQIHKPPAQRNVADIDLPDLIGPVDSKASEQLGILVPGQINDRGPGLAVYRSNGHELHQTAYFVLADLVALMGQIVGVAAFATRWIFLVHAVHGMHDLKILLTDRGGFVVAGRTGQPQQAALPGNTWIGKTLVHQFLAISHRHHSSFFFEPVGFHLHLADLLVEFFNLLLPVLVHGIGFLIGKGLVGVSQKLLFPVCNLIGMQFIVLSKLADCLAFFESFQYYFGLEARAKVSAFTFHVGKLTVRV